MNGRLVSITFLDHVQGRRVTPLVCIVHGRVSHVSVKSITVDCWEVRGSESLCRANNERFTIVRSSITNIKEWK